MSAPSGVTIRPQRLGDDAERDAVLAVVGEAFGRGQGTDAPDERVPALLADLWADVERHDHAGLAASLVAVADDGRVVAHVQTSRSWLDAPRAQVPVAVLSPLAVAASHAGQGVGRALVAAAAVHAEAAGSPFLLLEGDPGYYGRLGFVAARGLGLASPTPRIPPAAFQALELPAREPWMTGRLVYPDVFWRHESSGLRPVLDPAPPPPAPEGAWPRRLAVVLLVDGEGRLLLQERDENAPRAANLWGMVGGHVEPGEAFADAVVRELAEETGLRAEVGDGPGGLRLWREQWFRYSDLDAPFLYQVWVGRTGARDEDVVVGEGRQIVFVDPHAVPGLAMSESTRRFTGDFLASREYRELLAGASTLDGAAAARAE